MDYLRDKIDQPMAMAAGDVFLGLPDAYLLLDHRNRVVLANDHYLKALACDLDDVINRSIFEINQFGSAVQSTARNQWIADTLDRLAPNVSATSAPFAYDMPSADGTGLSPRYWIIKATLLELEPSGPPFTIIRVDEVTGDVAGAERHRRERAQLRSEAQLRRILAKEAEANYRESQDRFLMALEFAQLGSWERNTASGEFLCSDQCKVNLGIAASENVSEQRFFHELVDEADRGRVLATMEEALRQRRPFEADYRRTWPDGSKHWLMIKGVGRYGQSQRLLTVVGFTLDITARKEYEIAQENNARDEREARQRSDQAAHSMDHFVTAVSHELRSPLGAIVSWASLLERSPEPAHITRGAEAIQRNARQLTHMVDDLLDSGAIISGKLSVVRLPVDLGSLAGNVLEDIRPVAEAKGLKVAAPDISPCLVFGDENRLRQVVWNLLTNAVKFTTEGVITLAVRQDGEDAILAVQDSGRGIAPEAAKSIFERFAQVDKANSGRVGGLGLGLWLVKTLVDLHGGRIEVQSEGIGQGTTFKVSLPCV